MDIHIYIVRLLQTILKNIFNKMNRPLCHLLLFMLENGIKTNHPNLYALAYISNSLSVVNTLLLNYWICKTHTLITTCKIRSLKIIIYHRGISTLHSKGKIYFREE